MAKISFINSQHNYVLKNKNVIKKWIIWTIEKEKKCLKSLNIVFCSEKEMHDLNLKYLNHDTRTDVITFDYTNGKEIEGEICINVEMVKENSKKYSVDFKFEMQRVIIHGVLHLLGYKDKSKKDKGIMKSKEDFYLTQIPEIQ